MNEPAPARLVMIVDDDPVVLDVLERLLLRWGYRTAAFLRFEDARAALDTAVPDALVVDIRLGGHNGLQLVHLARQSHPQMVIVVVSGFDDPVLRREARLVGAPYLLKPQELPGLKNYLPAPTVD